MRIITPQDFFPILKNKYLLLDTSVFIDAFLNDKEFSELFNNLKDNNTILVTIDAVKIEFLQGAQDEARYEKKEEFFEQIVPTCLPTKDTVFDNVYELIRAYKEDGKSLSVTDLLLGAILMQYKRNLFLLTKNTTEFPTGIFILATYFNISYTKGLHSYGVYRII